MPRAEDPACDPFAGLVLDEEFVRNATVRERSGRRRIRAALWRRHWPAPAFAAATVTLAAVLTFAGGGGAQHAPAAPTDGPVRTAHR